MVSAKTKKRKQIRKRLKSYCPSSMKCGIIHRTGQYKGRRIQGDNPTGIRRLDRRKYNCLYVRGKHNKLRKVKPCGIKIHTLNQFYVAVRCIRLQDKNIYKYM